jgi:hypothetical protein
VQADLVDSGLGLCDEQELGELLDAVVGDTNRANEPFLLESLELSPYFADPTSVGGELGKVDLERRTGSAGSLVT